MRLRVVVSDDTITTDVDGIRALTITHPLATPRHGTIGLFVDIGTEAFFSRLRVTVES
jgi:hypothetical protein